MCWPTAASRNCRTTQKLSFLALATPRPVQRPVQRPILREVPRLDMVPGALPLESVTSLYIAAGCDRSFDGGHSAGGDCQLYAAPGVGAAAGWLFHNTSFDLLPRSQPRCACHDGDRAP